MDLSALLRFQQIVEAAGDVIYTTDRNGYLTYVNARVHKLLGYLPEEVAGRHFTDFIAPAWQEKVEAFYREQYRARTSETCLEFPVLAANGDEIWIEQVVVLLQDGEHVSGFQATVRNTTWRKMTEQMLQKSEQRYRALFEQTNDAVFILDLNGHHLAANQRACDLLGYESGELAGTPFLQVISSTEQMQAILFMKNLAMAGGFLVLAAHGPGDISLDNRHSRPAYD